MTAKPTTTAKELACKAFCDAVKMEKEGWFTKYSPEERFEVWWSEYFIGGDHKDSFNTQHNVYINGHRYIKAE